VNLYMFHGGTSFGWMNGANTSGKQYQPTVTSYDYDAPVSESGELTPKYVLFRDVIAKATGVHPPAPPAPVEVRSYTQAQFTRSASLFETLPKPVKSSNVQPMEALGQSYGYILYRTNVDAAQSGELKLDELHQYAQVYLDGKLAGTLDRRMAQSALAITVPHDKTRLDILVENTGRVNFGHQFPMEWTGITHGVTLADKPLTGWEIYSLPMRGPGKLHYQEKPCESACFYKASFDVDKPADTFLDTRAFGKGVVWVNGTPLGRFWTIGPQGALYLPAPFLHKGRNEVVIFDLEGNGNPTVKFSDKPVLDFRP
jgi:beta-galactosidase